MAKESIDRLKSLDLGQDSHWKQRFRTNKVSFATVAKANPQRGLVCCQADGVLQLHAWEVDTGALTQVTYDPVGVWRGAIAAKGDYIYYLADHQRNEIGHYQRISFSGGQPEDITPALSPYSIAGISEDPTGQILGFTIATETGFQGYIVDRRNAEALSAPRCIWQSDSRSFGPSLSANGDIAIFGTTARSGKNAYNLVAVAVATGAILQDLWFPDVNIKSVRFGPHSETQRFLATTDRSGFVRPLIWNLADGTHQTIELSSLMGDVQAWDWSTAGELLLCQYFQAQQQLYRYRLATQALTEIIHPTGTISGGQFRGDGQILITVSSPAQASAVFALDVQPQSAPKPVLTVGTSLSCQPWRSVSFPSKDGTEIQAWLARPAGKGPFPTILHTHGGPTSVLTEVYSPKTEAWLEHGFAWMSVNYRGSVTFGQDFERAIWGQLGQLEVEDMAAAHTWLVEHDIADPAAILVTGASYGGYLTLQALGMRPDLWAGGIAEVAIADWFLMYEDQSPVMQAAQRSFFGGTPTEKPEAHRIGSPITYIEQVKAPILVIQRQSLPSPPDGSL